MIISALTMNFSFDFMIHKYTYLSYLIMVKIIFTVILVNTEIFYHNYFVFLIMDFLELCIIKLKNELKINVKNR